MSQPSDLPDPLLPVASTLPHVSSQGHPRGLYTLFFTEMWERLSYYGMRALLVLFMVDAVKNGGFGLTDKSATAIYGLYTAAVYLTALPGGWVGDRLLGAKGSVWWGGIIITLGHLVLGVQRTETFYLGLLLVALGSGLLKSNMSALVGQLYPEGGTRRDAGFTLFYMGINIGAFIGPLVCSELAKRMGWAWGFSAAAVGMMLGLAQFRLTGKHLAGVGELAINPGQKRSRDWLMLAGGLSLLAALTTFALAGIVRIDPVWLAGKTANAIVALAVLFFGWTFCFAGLTKAEKKRVGVIVVLFAASATFWAGFEQVGSSFTLFAERYTIREWGGWKVAAGSFQSLGPFFVVTLAPVVAWLWIALGRRQIAPSLATKFAWGLLLLAAGFLVAAWAAQRALSSGPVWPTWLITVYLLHTIGELFLSPVGLSAVTKLSPTRLAGQMMGVWFLGTALGNLIAGRIAGEVSGENAAAMPVIFLQAVGTAGGAGLLLWWCAGRIQRLMPGVK